MKNKMNNALANLKKAHQAQAVSNDSYTLQKWVAADKGTVMLKAIEVKYIPQYDASSPLAKQGVSGNGFRTRLFTEDGETIGTFSGAAYNFFQFIAAIVGVDAAASYMHIDIDGVIPVNITKVALDGGKSTYNFLIDETKGELYGFGQYVPTMTNILALPEAETSEEE